MKVEIEINEIHLRQLVLNYLKGQLGDLADDISDKDIAIEVKSKQNYKSEWESASFRARLLVGNTN